MGLFSVVGGLIGGNSVKKGLNKASAAQAGSSAAQSANLDTALAQITSGYSPYSSLGASGAQAYADLLGIGGSSGSTTTGQNDWQAYLQRNPDVLQEYNTSVNKSQFPTAEAYAQWHYGQYGTAEGRANGVTTTGPAISAQDAQANAIAGLEKSPLFSSLVRNGEESILANASATGGLRGGNTQTGLANFRSDTLAQVIQQQLAGYQGAISTGMGAQGALTGANLGVVGAQNGAQQSATDALIQKILGKAGINSQNWSNIGAFADKALSGGGAGKAMSAIGKLF